MPIMVSIILIICVMFLLVLILVGVFSLIKLIIKHKKLHGELHDEWMIQR